MLCVGGESPLGDEVDCASDHLGVGGSPEHQRAIPDAHPNTQPTVQCMLPKLLTAFGRVIGHPAVGEEQLDVQWLPQDPDAGGQYHPA